MKFHIVCYHTTSHHITPHHIASHHTSSYRITSHHITSHHITPHHITSHHTSLHHITPHHTSSHHTTYDHYHHISSHHLTICDGTVTARQHPQVHLTPITMIILLLLTPFIRISAAIYHYSYVFMCPSLPHTQVESNIQSVQVQTPYTGCSTF